MRRRGKGLGPVHGELKNVLEDGWKLEPVHQNIAPARITYYALHEATHEVRKWLGVE